MTVETRAIALVAPAISHPISLFHRIWPVAGVGVAVLPPWHGQAFSDTSFSGWYSRTQQARCNSGSVDSFSLREKPDHIGWHFFRRLISCPQRLSDRSHGGIQ
jgi:hypothetical protein